MPLFGQFQFRRDTAANWTSANPTLLSGELGLEIDTGRIKIGNGALAWINLGYAVPLFRDAEVPAATGNPGVYTLANAPNPPSSLQCFVGLIQAANGVDYTLNGNQIAFVIAPARAPLCWYRF